MYTPPYIEPILTMVSTFGPWSPLYQFVSVSGAPPSGTFEAANRAVYVPVIVPTTSVIRRLWWANGGTVSASYNVDVGIYADAGYQPGMLLIGTGSTAQGTASVLQFVDVTDTSIAPGLYWLAIACSSTSATFHRILHGTSASAMSTWRMQQDTALPLPATATPTAATEAYLPLFGFATTASP